MAYSLDLSCFHKKVPARALNQDSQTSVWEQSMPLQYFADSSVQMGRFLPTWAGKSTIILCEPTFCCRHLAGWAEDFMGEHLDTFFVFPLFTFYLKTLSLYLMPLSWWWDLSASSILSLQPADSIPFCLWFTGQPSTEHLPLPRPGGHCKEVVGGDVARRAAESKLWLSLLGLRPKQGNMKQ